MKERHDINWIVQEVVRRLEAQLRTPAARHMSEEKQSNTLALSDRVVSIASIESRLSGVSTLSVPAGAVVTPAVRDLLREKKIQLAYTQAAAPTSAVRYTLAVGVADASANAAAVVSGLGELGVGVKRLAAAGLPAVTRELCEAIVRDGNFGLLLTRQTFAAVCLANRTRGVRAFAAGNLDEVKQALDAIGGNLLVVDPDGKGQFVVRRMVTEFCREGARPCPPELT